MSRRFKYHDSKDRRCNHNRKDVAAVAMDDQTLHPDVVFDAIQTQALEE